MSPAPPGAPFHLLTKPVGAACNLDCSYCFYLQKSGLYPQAGPRRMRPEVLEALVRSYLATQPGDEVHFAWQGGEPTLLGLPFFEDVVALQRRLADGRTVHNALQTNGTLLDDAWGAFLARERFLVGISVDGPAHLHDAYRVDKGGHPTYRRVAAGLEVLRRHKVEFNTLTTVHRRNSAHGAEVYRHLRRLGSRYLQFIPIVERIPVQAGGDRHRLAAPPGADDPGEDGAVAPWSVRPVDYGEFLIAVYEEWLRSEDIGRVFVQTFDAALANWLGLPPGVCTFAERCGRALAVEHNGDVYACDHYVDPAHRRGNLLDGDLAVLVDSPAQLRFGAAKAEALPRLCRECRWRSACHGECPKHRFLRTPSGEPGLNYLCTGLQRFFRHVEPGMATMAELLRRGRPASDLLRLPRSRWLAAAP